MTSSTLKVHERLVSADCPPMLLDSGTEPLAQTYQDLLLEIVLNKTQHLQM